MKSIILALALVVAGPALAATYNTVSMLEGGTPGSSVPPVITGNLNIMICNANGDGTNYVAWRPLGQAC
jgi:hypothetical protein